MRGKGGRQTSIEWFRSELERQTTPAWNRAVAAIAGAIRDAETEARALATETVEWRRHDASETELLATWAEKAESLGYFPCICEECGGPALASHAGGDECLDCGRHAPGESYAWSPEDLAREFAAELAVAEGHQGILHTAQVVTNVPNMLRSHPETTPAAWPCASLRPSGCASAALAR